MRGADTEAFQWIDSFAGRPDERVIPGVDQRQIVADGPDGKTKPGTVIAAVPVPLADGLRLLRLHIEDGRLHGRIRCAHGAAGIAEERIAVDGHRLQALYPGPGGGAFL